MANNVWRDKLSGRLTREAFVKTKYGNATASIASGFWGAVAGGANNYTQSISGSLAITGSFLKKAITRTLAGTLSGSALLLKLSARTLSSTITTSAPLVRFTTKTTPLTGSITASATLATMLLFTQILSGSLTITGQIVGRAITKTMLGTLTGSGSLLKKIYKTVSGSLTITGSVLKGIYKALQGVIASTATYISKYSTSRSIESLMQAFSSLISVVVPVELPNTTEASAPNHMRRFQGRR